LRVNRLRCARASGASSDLAISTERVFGLVGHFDFGLEKHTSPRRIPTRRIPNGLIRCLGLTVVCLFQFGFNSRSALIDFGWKQLLPCPIYLIELSLSRTSGFP
jgi:hypothetical protein